MLPLLPIDDPSLAQDHVAVMGDYPKIVIFQPTHADLTNCQILTNREPPPPRRECMHKKKIEWYFRLNQRIVAAMGQPNLAHHGAKYPDGPF